MKTENDELVNLITQFAKEDYCYLTTRGRKSGNPHEIEIWFGIQGGTLYLLSGGGDKSDWVRNLRANPNVTLRIAKHAFSGTARIVNDEDENTIARYILAEKYQEWGEGRTLSEWARTALVVGIDITRIT